MKFIRMLAMLFLEQFSLLSGVSDTFPFFFLSEKIDKYMFSFFCPATLPTSLSISSLTLYLPTLIPTVDHGLEILKPPIYYLHWSSTLMGLLPLMCYFLSCQVSTPSSVIIGKLSFIYLFIYLVTWFILEDKHSPCTHLVFIFAPWVEVHFLIRENHGFITQANTANPTRLKLSHSGLFNAWVPFLKGFEVN